MRHAAGILALAVALTRCAVGPNFTRPEPPSPPRYTAEPMPTQLTPAAGEGEQRLELAREISAQWWQVFRSPELDDVIELALRDSPNLKAARATLAQAEQAVVATRGGLFPQLDVGGGVARVHTPGRAATTSTDFSVGPTVSYALDLFGGVRRSVEEQAALAELQYHGLAAAWLALTGNTVTVAVTIASLRAQIDASVELVQDDRHNLELVQHKFEAGKVARSDVLVAQTQLGSDLALLPPLRQQLAVAQHALTVLAGQLPGEWSPPEFTLDDFTLPGELPLSLPSELVRQRPDILAAESLLHASSAAIGVATAQLFPSLTLSSDVTRASLLTGGAGTAWALAAQATAPVFHGGTLWSQRRGAIDAYQASLASYEETVLTGFEQVADTLRALAHDADLVGAQAQLLDTARESLALQRISYEAGKSDLLLLLAAQRAYQQARLDFAQAEGQRLLDSALLFVALGGGWWQAGI
jgi:NodT family efflux transporter outer membrane factor (OMF) lipoprotein